MATLVVVGSNSSLVFHTFMMLWWLVPYHEAFKCRVGCDFVFYPVPATYHGFEKCPNLILADRLSGL
uniref:Uncharacterized protein n=1 Tax=Oryza barthii TaxID=65489 RepID=A0A0D3F6A5_9ORYZ